MKDIKTLACEELADFFMNSLPHSLQIATVLYFVSYDIIVSPSISYIKPKHFLPF